MTTGRKTSRKAGATKSAAPKTGFGFKRILVPIDFSETSKKVLRHACRYAEYFNASLVLVHVNPTAFAAEFKLGLKKSENEALIARFHEQLASIHQKQKSLSDKVDTVVVSGSPFAEICRIAEGRKADLIMISTHGRTGLDHVMLGSTAERIVRHAKCPVLTMHKSLLENPKARLSPKQLKRILAPLDFSAPSQKAATRAAKLAETLGAKVTLMHVNEVAVYPDYPEIGFADLGLLAEQQAKAASARLVRLAARIGKQGAGSDTHVCDGVPYQEIAAYAKENKQDLIVISTHGHSSFIDALLGSTAERVVQHAPCPVLVLRQK